MVDPDTHPSGIRGKIVDAIGHRPAEFLDQEVMDPDLFRIALRAILAAIVAEIPDQFLFLGVDRDHRLLFGQSRGHLGVDVAELRIPVGVAVALLGLAVALQAVTRIIEQFGDQGAAHLMALLLAALAPVGARSCRSTAAAIPDPPRRRFDQRLEIPQQARDPAFARAGLTAFCVPLPAAEPAPRVPPRPIPAAPPDRARRNAGRHRHRRNPSITRGERLGRRDQTTAPFVEKRRYRRKPLSDGLDIDHHHKYGIENTVVNPYFTLSKVDSFIS